MLKSLALAVAATAAFAADDNTKHMDVDARPASANDAVVRNSAAGTVTTVVGPPEVMGGPTCCKFDSPFLGLSFEDARTVAYTSNSETYLWSNGSSVSAQLPVPQPVNLTSDPDASSYSHCGKWANAAWIEDSTGLLHMYFHQEHNCNYSAGGYTNKSVGYAVSSDGGYTFQPSPAPSPTNPGANQLIAGSNFSTNHQCGEGDHGVVQWGDYLLMFFLEWDGPSSIHGGTSLSVARSAIADAGRPGTWWKWYNGGWSSPGVGGPCDDIGPNITGTAVYNISAVGALMSIGVIYSGPVNVAWSGDGLSWAPAAAGPLFYADYGSWNRNVNSTELFAYPSLTGPQGVNRGVPMTGSYTYFTYLAPGTDFTQRWMVRRSLNMYISAAAPGTPPPPALATLSVWSSNSSSGTPPRAWVTTGPVVPPSGYNLTTPVLARLVTAETTAPLPTLAVLRECLLSSEPYIVALTTYGECGGAGGAFAAGRYLRTAGWAGKSAADATALGWAATQPGASVGPLWRCVRERADGTPDYSATFNDQSCVTAGAGYRPDVLLGYAISDF